jgi:hypothetical protein
MDDMTRAAGVIAVHITHTYIYTRSCMHIPVGLQKGRRVTYYTYDGCDVPYVCCSSDLFALFQ